MLKYYDCHSHEIGQQTGGFLIALDGKRGCTGGYSNKEVILTAKEANLIPVQYVTYQLEENLETEILKYHPRREQYSVLLVEKHIEKTKPKIVIIDTLNAPYWKPEDYWRLAIKFPDIGFLFSHAGGFDIVEFLKIVMFQKNVWIDFSFTQHVFGWCGTNESFPVVTQSIDYAMKDPRIYKKILFGSDSMRSEKELASEALISYENYDSFLDVIDKNFMNFIEEYKINDEK